MAEQSRADGRRTIDAQFERILNDRDLTTLFQPIVHLPTGGVVGYEALLRGPENSPLSSAESLMAAADRIGRLAELDWAARASACRAAMAADVDVDNLLLMNIEPIAVDSDCPEDLWPDIERSFQKFRVVLEVTERSLDRDPATLLDGIERQRPRLAGIGLDDVGSSPATVAMLPLVSPDVIKIDRSIIQPAPNEDVSTVLSAAHREAERTDATLLAEGVETAEHRYHAMAQGIRIGQGYLFGHPGPLSSSTGHLSQRAPIRRSVPTFVTAPFDVLSGRVDATANEDVMVALTRQFAGYACASVPALYVTLVPEPHLLAEEDMDNLAYLAGTGSFAAVLGPGVPAEPGRGVRGTGSARNPLPRDEWASVAIGRYGSSAMLARRAPETDNEWMYGVTNDLNHVTAAARCLVRLLGAPEQQFHFEA